MTKEELKDLELFINFIDYEIENCLLDLDEDTKQDIIRGYFVKNKDSLGLCLLITPDDWNYLHEAYGKCLELIKNEYNIYRGLNNYIDEYIQPYILENDKEKTYYWLLEFIRGYNEINSNTNNNQS